MNSHSIILKRWRLIAKKSIFAQQIGLAEVAGEHGGGAQVGFAIGKHREFHREATGLDHAAFDVLGDLAEMRVARGQLRPGVADADDRLAMELMVGNALVLHPAAVHEAVLVGGTKPLGGA